MVSAECTRVSIPQQGIIGERGNRIAQVIDIGGVGGDIGCVLVNAVGIGSDISSVLIHFLICIKQLGAVNGIGAVRGQGACRQIGDLAGASRVVSAECTRVSIPQQGIVGERGNSVAQTVDIGGIGGDISGVLIDAVGIGSDISSILIHFLICIKQLGAVNGIGAVRGQGACRQIGDFAVASTVVSAECACAVIPQQRVIG